MTGFRADPDAIAALGKLMGRAYLGASWYPSHLSGPNDVGQGLLSKIGDQLDRLQQIGTVNTELAADRADICSETLEHVAKYYRETDLQEAERLDRTYPEAKSPLVCHLRTAGTQRASGSSKISTGSRSTTDRRRVRPFRVIGRSPSRMRFRT